MRKMNRQSGLEQETIQDMGNELIEHAQQEMIPVRGKLEELFPYIVIASRHMSARAISRWFTDKKGLKISAASVAKAIREKEHYCKLIVDRARTGAEYLANLSDFDADSILVNKDGALDALSSEYDANLNGTEEQRARSKELIMGLKMLREWEELPDEIRTLCMETCVNTNGGKER